MLNVCHVAHIVCSSPALSAPFVLISSLPFVYLETPLKWLLRLMTLSRRDFMKTGLKASAAMALALKSSNINAFDLNFDFSSLMDMTRFVVPDPTTLSYSVGSPCCKFCFDRYVVFHYQPVAFVEVTRSTTDSFATGGAGNPLTSTVSSDGKEQHSFEARVWDLPQIVIDLAFGLQACRLCGKPRGIGNPASQIDVAAMAELTQSLCSTPMDVVASEMKAALQGMTDQLLASMPGADCIPRVLYDTGHDTHWRTGCRDIALAAPMGPVCEIPGGITSGIAELSGMGYNPCVGSWGSVLPRQQRVLNHDVQTAAALTAYRAIHVAKHTWKTFPYDASLKGKLQQTIPNPATGFFPGTNKLIFNQGRMTPVDGKWVFVWWVPVTCCKKINEIAGLCPPAIPCL